MARLRASTPRRNPRQSRDLSDRTAAAISARSRSRRASGAVRARSALREGAFCSAKHRACLWRPVRCRRIVRASCARMPTAATAIDACSERRKKTAGSRAPKAASREVGGRRQSDLRGWRALTRVEHTALLRRQRAREYVSMRHVSIKEVRSWDRCDRYTASQPCNS